MNPRQRAAYFEGRKKLRSSDAQTDTIPSEITRNIGATNVNEGRVQAQDEEASRLTSASAAFGRNLEHYTPTPRNFNDRSRREGAIHSGLRRISLVNNRSTISIPTNYAFRGRAEIDTRADTTCAGAAFALIETTGKECDVTGFHDNMAPLKNIPIATCATAYDHLELQETVILLFHEALYFGKEMEHSLINPNQIRENGITVDCCPCQYDKSSIHGIYVPSEDITFPFRLHGCISYVQIRLPTDNELKQCRYIEMTSERVWQPYSDTFQNSENPLSLKTKAADNIRASRHIGATTSTDRRCDIDAVTLSERLGISHHIAQETLKSTTQLASRKITEPLTRRLRT